MAKNKNLFLWGLVVLVVLVVSVLLFFGWGGGGVFSVNVGGEGDNLRDHDLFINSFYFSSPIETEGVRFRDFKGSNGEIILNLKRKLQLRDNLIVTAKLKGEEDLQLAVDCYSCKNKDVYNYSIILDEDFYFKKAANYKKVAEFSELNILTKKGLDLDLRESSSLKEWIDNNIIEGDIIQWFGKGFNLNELALIKGKFDNYFRQISLNFRGDFEALAYFRDDVKLEIGKRDLNWYDGPDVVQVTMTDANGKEIYNDIINDDGSKTGMVGGEQIHTIRIKDVEDGLYKIKIQGVLSEESEIKNDFVITEVKVNSNRFVVNGDFSVVNGGEMYCDLDRPASIKLYAWTPDQIQQVKVNDQTMMEITENDLERQDMFISLPAGKNTLSFEKGLLISSKDVYFALTLETLFRPFPFDYFQGGDSDFILTPMDFSTDEQGWVTVTKKIPVSSLLKFWNVNGNLIQQITFVLMSPVVNEILAQNKLMKERGLPEMDVPKLSLADFRVRIERQ